PIAQNGAESRFKETSNFKVVGNCGTVSVMASSRRQYPFHLIEPKWQSHWDRHSLFRAWNPGGAIPSGHPFAARHGNRKELPPKYYVLDMFPYPSGAGLHVGH